MAPLISIIIPNRNGEATIGLCLAAALASRYEPFEVIVVDDHSEDGSIEVIERFACKLICLGEHGGASRARNTGAAHSRGDVLFFTDADCLVEEDTLAIAAKSLSSHGPRTIIGGTYSREPYDRGFFNRFQAIFVNYSECKKAANADYAAAHAMVIAADTFRNHQGFPEAFLPMIEDVEFSHRLRRAGFRIVINPDLKVRHIFNFSLYRSLRNAIFKSMHWTIYSIANRDIFADSGTASVELKTTAGFFAINVVLLVLFVILRNPLFLYLTVLPITASLWVSRGLMKAFYEDGGAVFAVAAAGYYLFVYPIAVGAGSLVGLSSYFAKRKLSQR